MRIDDNITTMKGIGEKTAENFYKLGIYTIRDLLAFYPRSFMTFEPVTEISTMSETGTAAIIGTVQRVSRPLRIRSLFLQNIQILSGKHTVKLTFFNMPYIAKVLKEGTTHVFRGKLQVAINSYKMEQPQVMDVADYESKVNLMQPVYRLTQGLSNNTILKAVLQAKNCFAEENDYLTEEECSINSLMPYSKALEMMHFPASNVDFSNARKRLVFNEFLEFLMSVKRLRAERNLEENPFQMLETAETGRILDGLPYQLTQAQMRVWNEIKEDLQSNHIMNRLIQGDVGSGKTIIAFLSMIMCVSNGYQAALMAPTEVLACQHYEQMSALLQKMHFNFTVCLLSGSTKQKDRTQIYKSIEDGTCQIIIGTHAIFQEKVNYRKLALVITDEQHRFGVRQREKLVNKNTGTHVIVMSATPIPRTLAMILYSDMNLSVIDELPAGRKPIKNCVVGENFRPQIHKLIQSEVENGHQIYIICPMIEENETMDVENVIEYYEKLKAELPESIQIGLLHGKMKPSVKNSTMEDFSNHKLDILVATTVIEVGVNVPNATVMIIENAERFGLATLHQLRGRVGRSDTQSYCVFVDGHAGKDKNPRLEILLKSNDGFQIANEDLKLRGPGDITGVMQSGDMPFELGDIYNDADMLSKADQFSDRLLSDSADFSVNRRAELITYFNLRKNNEVDFKTI